MINVLLHALAGFIFMWCGIQLFFAPRRLAPRIWVSVLSVLATIGTIVMIIMGATDPDPNSVGVHSPGDWVVVIAITAGALLWFATLPMRRVQPAKARQEAVA